MEATKQKFEIDPDRLARIMQTPILKGSHVSPPNGECHVCIMEAFAYVTRQPHRDRDVCPSPIIESFLRSWNDGLPTDADRDRLLKPLLPRLAGVAGGGELEDRRFWTICDWLIREFTPPWLELAKLDTEAGALRSLAEITGPESIESSLRAIQAAKEKASAAGAAARAAGRAAAGDAAWAAAGDAAWDAAGDAARAAAWDAAWDAAGKTFAPVVSKLQDSALALVVRLIEIR